MCITRLPPAHQSTRAECDLLSSVTLSSQSNGSDFSLWPRISSKKMGNESSTSTLFPRRRLGDGSKFNFFFFFTHTESCFPLLFFFGGGGEPTYFSNKSNFTQSTKLSTYVKCLLAILFWIHVMFVICGVRDGIEGGDYLFVRDDLYILVVE